MSQQPPDPPMRLVMDPVSTSVRHVPASTAIRALLHQAGFRRVASTDAWQLPPALPYATRVARLANLIRGLDHAKVPLLIDDRRPAPADPSDVRGRLAQIYTGRWTFDTGHQSYILAVATTVQVRGMPLREVTVRPGRITENRFAATDLSVTPRTAAIELADGRAVTWDEAAGWRDSATGAALPLSQVADPATVAGAVAALPVPAAVDTGRDPATLDPVFEQALAVYRAHPGVAALHRTEALDEPGPYRLMPDDVRAIRQWQPPRPAPPRWETTTLVTVDNARGVAQAWRTPVRRSAVTSYRPASVAAQRQLRQARLQRTNGDQRQPPQR